MHGSSMQLLTFSNCAFDLKVWVYFIFYVKLSLTHSPDLGWHCVAVWELSMQAFQTMLFWVLMDLTFQVLKSLVHAVLLADTDVVHGLWWLWPELEQNVDEGSILLALVPIAKVLMDHQDNRRLCSHWHHKPDSLADVIAVATNVGPVSTRY